MSNACDILVANCVLELGANTCLLMLACGLQFRDEYSVFAQAGAEVVGISSDKPEALVEFANSQRLNFPLLSDEGGKLRKGLKIKGAAQMKRTHCQSMVPMC